MKLKIVILMIFVFINISEYANAEKYSDSLNIDNTELHNFSESKTQKPSQLEYYYHKILNYHSNSKTNSILYILLFVMVYNQIETMITHKLTSLLGIKFKILSKIFIKSDKK